MRARIDTRKIVTGLAFLLAGSAILLLIEGFIGSPAAGAALGAIAVDLLVGRAGVRWSGESPAPYRRDVRLGLGLGASAGLLIVALGHALGWATVMLGVPSLSLGLSLVRVFASAARDELLFRWMPIALGRQAGVPDRALTAFVVAVAVAPLLLASPTPVAVASTAAQAYLGAALARTTSGAIAPLAAHAALALTLGPLTRGGVLDVTWWSGDPGPAPHAAGVAGWAAIAIVVVAGLLVPRLARRA